jgi:hypothetical protein
MRTDRWRDEVRPNTVKSERYSDPVAYEARTVKPLKRHKTDTRSATSNKLISSKNSFVQSKKDLSAMRGELEKRSHGERTQQESRSGVATVSKRSASTKKITKNTQQVAHAQRSKSSTRASKNTSSGDKSKSRKTEKHESR